MKFEGGRVKNEEKGKTRRKGHTTARSGGIPTGVGVGVVGAHGNRYIEMCPHPRTYEPGLAMEQQSEPLPVFSCNDNQPIINVETQFRMAK